MADAAHVPWGIAALAVLAVALVVVAILLAVVGAGRDARRRDAP